MAKLGSVEINVTMTNDPAALTEAEYLLVVEDADLDDDPDGDTVKNGWPFRVACGMAWPIPFGEAHAVLSGEQRRTLLILRSTLDGWVTDGHISLRHGTLS